jgi:ABC-type nickel/cobalt efflux system permease component RcnA
MSHSPGHISLRRGRSMVTRIFIVLIALFYGYMAYANVVSTSHDPTGHDNAQLAASDAGGHDHDHDTHSNEGGGAGHQHGQHTSDHSHDKSNLPNNASNTLVKIPVTWNKSAQTSGYPEPCFFFERPPKQLPVS